jgi:peptidoglycan/LPS O-acetylase OafA/YrhL
LSQTVSVAGLPSTPNQVPAKVASHRIPQLDGLRGLAILLVLLCHYIGNSDRTSMNIWLDRTLWLFRAGWSGVDLFFVLSGFLIGGILLNSRDSPRYFRTFYLRRAHRILPIYYLLLLFFVLTVGILQFSARGRSFASPSELLVVPKCFFFLQNIFSSLTNFQWRWFVVTWSLAVEEQFYLFAPLLVRFLSLRRLTTALIAFVVVSPVARFIFFQYFPDSWLNGSLAWRADTIAFGMLAAIAWRNPAIRQFLFRNPRPLRWAFTFFVAGLVLLLKSFCILPIPLVTIACGYSWLAASFTCLLILIISQPTGWIARRMLAPWLRSLGTISYCLYLVHMPINQFAHLLFLHSIPRIYDWKGVSVTLLAAVLSLCVAALSWRYIESPLIRRGHTFHY